MSTEPSIRRYSIAVSAAVASITLALGVTAASLLGWLGPPQHATSPPEPIVEPTGPAAQPIEQPAATARPVEQAPAAQPVEEPPTIVLPPLEQDEVTLAMHHRDHDEDEDDDDEAERHEQDDDD